MNSSQLVLVMTGNAGHIAAGHEADGRFHHPQEIADFVRSNPTAIRYRRFPWLDNFLASEEQRLFAFSITLRNQSSFLRHYIYPVHAKKPGWDRDLAPQARKIQTVYDDVQRQYEAGTLPARINVDKLREGLRNKSPKYDASFFKKTAPAKMRELGARKACADLGAADIKECTRATVYTHDVIMNPMDARTVPVNVEMPMADVSNIDMTLRILESTKDDPYLQGLARYEQILAKHLENPHGMNTDVWTDLVHAFTATGSSPTDARERALEVLSVTSTNGSDFLLNESFFNHRTLKGDEETYEPTNPKFVTLTRLSMALPYFDLVKPGNLYSLPPGYASECDTSKYYHFWMSAFLTRQLIKAGFGPRTAGAAVMATHLGYRALYDPFAADFSATSPGHFILRTDLANVALGIVFGANLQTPTQAFSFQEFFDLTVPDGRHQPGLMDKLAGATLDSAQAYSKFMQKIGVISLWKRVERDLPERPH